MPHISPAPHFGQRRLSVGSPNPPVEIQGPVGPGFARPKHRSVTTGMAPPDIKGVEATIPEPQRETWRKYVCFLLSRFPFVAMLI